MNLDTGQESAHPDPSHTDDIIQRSAHSIPSAGTDVSAPIDIVFFHHPGYPDIQHSVLLSIPPCSVNRERKPSLEYSVAWQACYVLAVERAGFFTAQPSRNSPRVASGQGLVAGRYWYHLDVEDEDEAQGMPYPTLRSFRAWRFDQRKMPADWKSAVPWNDRVDNDQKEGDCCITGVELTEVAHLIPKTEWEWWTESGMSDYAGTSGVTKPRSSSRSGQEMDVPGNTIRLNDSLHRSWDTGYFCLFPLRLADREIRLHCVFMAPMMNIVRYHHRRPVRGGLAHVSAACAWARFVFLIVTKYEKCFLAKATRRRLKGSVTLPEWVDQQQIQDELQDRPRNTSPEKKKNRSGSARKRQRSPSPGERADSAVCEPRISRDESTSPIRGRLGSREADRQRMEQRQGRTAWHAKRRKITHSYIESAHSPDKVNWNDS